MTKKIINNVRIENDLVSKKRNDNILELYDYLDISNFDNYPEVISVTEKEINSKYINQSKYHEITEGIEIIKTMSKLHSKTIFYKDVSKNKYKEIYNKILGNIEYLKQYYEEMIEDIETEVYMSPSHYLFARNYSIIMNSINYTTNELKKWYKLVENKTKERVCVVHNNIKKDHFIKGDKNYFISWDKHLVDTPILDLYKFYKKDGYKMDFKYLLNEYCNNFELLPEEKKLFFILINIPPKIEEKEEQLLNTIYIKDTFKYIYKSYSIVKD